MKQNHYAYTKRIFFRGIKLIFFSNLPKWPRISVQFPKTRPFVYSAGTRRLEEKNVENSAFIAPKRLKTYCKRTACQVK